MVDAQHPRAQRLQWFLSESTWEAQAVKERRLAVLRADPVTAPTIGLNRIMLEANQTVAPAYFTTIWRLLEALCRCPGRP